MIALAHLIGVAAALALVLLGVFDLYQVGWAIWNYEPRISVVALLFMAGLGALLLYLGVRIFIGIHRNYRAFCRRWQAERDRPHARIVLR